MCNDLLMLRGRVQCVVTYSCYGDVYNVWWLTHVTGDVYNVWWLTHVTGTCTMCGDLLMLRRRVQCVVTYWCYRGLVESIVAHSRFVFVVECLHQLVLVCSLILLISLSLPLCLLCLRQQKQLFAGQKRGKPIKNREKNDFREGKLTKLNSQILWY